MMSRIVAIVALLLAVSAATVVAQSGKGGGSCPIPGIGNFDCPTYSYNTTSYEVELRTYDAHTVILCPLYSYYPYLEVQAVSLCYPELDSYFNGLNQQRVSIPRTAPVSQYWEYDGIVQPIHFYFTLFYFTNTSTTAPAPLDSAYVHVVNVREFDVATIPFSPNATALDQEIIDFAVFRLSFLLNRNGVPFFSDAHHVSWYQPPFLPPRNLINEIWAFTIPPSGQQTVMQELAAQVPADKWRMIGTKPEGAADFVAPIVNAHKTAKHTLHSSRK